MNKPDFVTKVEIEKAKEYCKSMELEANGHGQFIYKCGSSEISLAYMLAAYAHDNNADLRKEIEDLKKSGVNICVNVSHNDQVSKNGFCHLCKSDTPKP